MSGGLTPCRVVIVVKLTISLHEYNIYQLILITVNNLPLTLRKYIYTLRKHTTAGLQSLTSYISGKIIKDWL